MSPEKVYIDTSAFYALMDRSDQHHKEAAIMWPLILERGQTLLTGNYIVVETMALLQSRLGFDAARMWYQDILSITDVIWTEQDLHNTAYEFWLSLGRRKLSLVDCLSFMTMRKMEIQKAFAFDKHFSEHGFEVLKENSLLTT